MRDMSSRNRTVLIAMDGSSHSDETFNWYMKNLRHDNDQVLLTWNVDTIPSSYGNVNLMTGDPDIISRAISEHATHINFVVRSLQQKLADSNVSGRVLQLHGPNSGESIVKAATQEGADVIVVGSRGLGTIRRTFLGSVSDFVLHHAHIPVCICRFEGLTSKETISLTPEILEKGSLENAAERRSVADDNEDDYDGTDDNTAPKEAEKSKTLRDEPPTNFDSNIQKNSSGSEATQRKLGMRDRANLIRIKAATDKIETLLSRFDMDSSVDETWSTYSGAETSTTTQWMQQTTFSPFPGAYQGYIPVISNSTGTSNAKNEPIPSSSSSKRSLKSRSHSHKSKTDGRWRRVSKISPYRRKYKTHANKNQPKLTKFKSNKNGIRTKGYQMTVLKTTNCSKFSSVESDILKTVWSLQNMMHKLGARINQSVRKLGNQGVDNTNEERADIKTNSDRISQLQQGLSGKIDDLRYNISILMTSQRELSKTVSGALEDMMHVLKQMVGLVTRKENEPESQDRKGKKPQTTKTSTTKEKAHAKKYSDVININKNTSADNEVKSIEKNTSAPVVEKDNGTRNNSKEETAKQKIKDGLTSPKRERKRQNIRKQKHRFLTDHVRRRYSSSSNDTPSFHNDHAIVNKFKNYDNSKDFNKQIHANEKGKPIDRQRFNKSHAGHHFQNKLGLKTSQNKHDKRMSVKSRRKLKHYKNPGSIQTEKRFVKDGRKLRGQGHSNKINSASKHMRHLARSSSVHKKRYRSDERTTKSKNEEDINEELERLLKQELNEFADD